MRTCQAYPSFTQGPGDPTSQTTPHTEAHGRAGQLTRVSAPEGAFSETTRPQPVGVARVRRPCPPQPPSLVSVTDTQPNATEREGCSVLSATRSCSGPTTRRHERRAERK